MFSMAAPSRVVRLAVKRVELAALAKMVVLVGFPFSDVLRHRTPLGVIGEILFEEGGLKLQQPGGGLQRIGYRIFVEET